MNAEDLPSSIDQINEAEAVRKRNARSASAQRVVEVLSKIIVWMFRPIGARL